jgi:predicted nuclease of predicted toxin-antitoxin system
MNFSEKGLKSASDKDFRHFQKVKPQPVQSITCGNVTNRNLQKLLSLTLAQALMELKQGENIVEINQINLA